jgi:hypothetical protein
MMYGNAMMCNKLFVKEPGFRFDKSDCVDELGYRWTPEKIWLELKLLVKSLLTARLFLL